METDFVFLLQFVIDSTFSFPVLNQNCLNQKINQRKSNKKI